MRTETVEGDICVLPIATGLSIRATSACPIAIHFKDGRIITTEAETAHLVERARAKTD